MKLTGVQLYADDINAITLHLQNAPEEDKFMVKTILGLDADEIVSKYYSSGAYSGKKYYANSLPARVIVMRIVLNPTFSIDESFSSVRDELYKTISSSRSGELTLNLMSGSAVIASIRGYISKFEVPHFSAVGEVQLTLYCDDPMFKGISPISLDPTQLSATNPVLVADQESTAPHGFEMQVDFTAVSTNFIIRDTAIPNDEWFFEVIPDGGFLVGDRLTIISKDSEKAVILTRASVDYQILNHIVPGSLWPILFPGENSFHIDDIANIDWVSLEFLYCYWGV